MDESVKSLLDLAATGIEVLAILIGSFSPVAPMLKLLLSAVPLTIEVVRYFRKKTQNIQENSHAK